MVSMNPQLSYGPNHDVQGSSHHPIDEFFKWIPPCLTAASRASKSARTRPPAFYDKHLHQSLILKEVLFLPSLPKYLADVVDNMIAKSSLPPVPSNNKHFPNAETRDHQAQMFTTCMKNESDIGNFYEHTTGKFCAVVASTLADHDACWHDRIFRWTSSSPQHQNAIADGFLTLDQDVIAKLPHLTPKSKELLIRVANNFPEIAVWEFKNLYAGSERCMQAIVEQANSNHPFNWASCKTKAKCTASHLSRRSQRQRLAVTGQQTGFDALQPFWTPASARDLPEKHALGKKLLTSPHNKLKAEHIIQQAWAEAVKHDSTILVIASGNLEVICVRDRAKKRLYMSPLIKVTEFPAYAKLHTGIFLAALQDAADRTKQLDAAITKPALWTYPYDNLEVGDDQIPIIEETETAAEERVNWILDQVDNSMDITLCSNPRPACGLLQAVLLFPQPVKFVRTEAPTLPLPGSGDQEIYLTLDHSCNGMVSRGSIEVDGQLHDRVIVKISTSPSDFENLKREFTIYHYLAEAKVPGIAGVIGLFEFHDRCRALILTHATGSSLNKRQRLMATTDINAFHRALKAIHDVGFLYHNSFEPENLFVDDAGNVTIVSLGHCRANPRLQNNGKGNFLDDEARGIAAQELDALTALLDEFC